MATKYSSFEHECYNVKAGCRINWNNSKYINILNMNIKSM